ncbi:MAG: TolC family protein [Deltaproteobacteria bacterium]|nr:TolC family protein [Deltaproteobacteria bacterium]
MSCVLTSLLAPAVAKAEREVSLEEAHALATTQNLNLLATQEEIRRADALVMQAWGRLLPSLNAEATLTVRDQATVAKIGPTELTFTPRTTWTGRAILSQPVFSPSTFLAARNAQDARAAAGLDVEAARRALRLTTASAYYAVVTARRIVEVSEHAKEVAQTSVRDATARLEAGSGRRIDVSRAEIDVQDAERRIAKARAALADAKEALGLILGVEGPVSARDAVLAAPSKTSTVGDGGERNRPEVKAATLRARMADRAVDAARWALGPTLDTAVALAWSHPESELTRDVQWQAMAVLTVPLYDASRYGMIRERRAERAQAHLRAEQLARELGNEIRAARRDMETQEIAVRTSEKQVETARETLRQAQAAYAVGTHANLEVIEAQQALRDAEVGLAVAQAEWNIAAVRLAIAAGQVP